MTYCLMPKQTRPRFSLWLGSLPARSYVLRLLFSFVSTGLPFYATAQSSTSDTTACLICHTEAAHQVQRSIHCTWKYVHPITGQILGKKTEINSFCGNVASNEPRCTSCHAGYGWTDAKTFDFTVEDKVDCLVRHDSTGTYQKWPTKADHPLHEPLTDAASDSLQSPLQTKWT